MAKGITSVNAKFNWKSLTDKESVQNFINERHLISPMQTRKDGLRGLLTHIKRDLNLDYDDFEWGEEYKKNNDFSYYDSIEKVQQYVDEHSDEITCASDFSKKKPHCLLYSHCSKSKSINLTKIVYSNAKIHFKWKELTTKEMILNFLIDNNIKNPSDAVLKGMSALLSHIKNTMHLTYEDFLWVNWQKPLSWNEYNSIEKVQTYINEHNEDITCATDFRIKHPHNSLYNHCLIIGLDTSKIIYKTPKTIRWKNLSTKELTLKFIDDNKIESPAYAKKHKMGELINHIKNDLNLSIDDFKWSNYKKLNDWSYYDSLEKILTYVDEHSNEIKCASDFSKKQPHCLLYSHCVKNKIDLVKIQYTNPKTINWTKLLHTKEDIQNYITENNIENPTFAEQNGLSGLLLFIYNSGYKTTDFKWINHQILNNWTYYDSIEKVQQYVNKNNDEITCASDFKNIKPHSYLYNHCINIKLNVSEIIYTNPKINDYCKCKTKEELLLYFDEHGYKETNDLPNSLKYYLYSKKYKYSDFNIILSYNVNSWDNYNTIDDVLKLIDSDNEIFSISDLNHKYSGLYNKCKRLNIDLNKVKFKKNNHSKIERDTSKFLKSINKYELFKEQHCFNDLRDYLPLRFDFYSNYYNLVLEPGGYQHLIKHGFANKINMADKFNTRIKHDQMKYDYCQEHNIHIIYYFQLPKGKKKEECLKVLETYPGEWYTDFDEYCQAILNYISLYEEEHIINMTE